MNYLLEWLYRIFGSWRFWVVIPPWENGIRVRLGKTADIMRPGLHFRVPFIDEITLVNTRLRVDHTGPVTLGVAGAQNRVRCVSAAVGFRIEDPRLGMLRFNNPSSAIVAYAQAELTKTQNSDELKNQLDAAFHGAGIVIEFVCLVEDVEIRAIKIMSGSAYTPFSGPGPTIGGPGGASFGVF